MPLVGSLVGLVTVMPGCADRTAESDERASLAETAQMPVLFLHQDDQTIQSPEKLALIVAIGEQGAAPQGAKSYKRLDGPPNDVGLVSAALQHHGFLEENILTLRDERATKDGILGALGSLIDRAGPGDIAVFYYAGHGHQITDDEANEEIDGYDEVLVPYGAPDHSAADKEVQAAYDGGYHIRDDTLGVLLDRLNAKVGPDGNVAVFLDACYSGTGTRGANQLSARGGGRPIGPPAAVQSLGGDMRGSGFAEAPRTGGPGSRGDTGLGYVVISAASHQQLAWETYHTDGETIVGPLSHALALALPKMHTGNSYRDLHALIVEVIRGKQLPQSPQIEGPADTEVFGNQMTDYESWVRVRTDQGDGDLVLEGGELRGLGIGSEVEMRASLGADDPDAVLTTGKVVQSSPLSSVVTLDSVPSEGIDLTTSRAFITREAYGDLTTKVAIDGGMDPEVAGLIRDSLQARWIVSVVTDDEAGADGVLEEEGGGGRIQLRTTYDRMPVGEPLQVSDRRGAGVLATHVENFARNAYLRKLIPDDPTIDVTLTLHPATADHATCTPARADTTRFGRADRLNDTNNDWRITPSSDEVFLLKVTNRGDSSPYFTILDLMPNGDIYQLFPPPYYSLAEARLEPQQEYVLPSCYAVDPIPGLEVIKLFATREPVDFRSLLTSRGRNARASGGPLHDLERLLTETYGGARSGGVGANPAMASVSSVQIEVLVPDTTRGEHER